MLKLFRRVPPVVTDRKALLRDWETAGDERDEKGELVPDGHKATEEEREAARVAAEADLDKQLDSRRSVIGQLNAKAATAAAVVGAFAGAIGIVLFQFVATQPQRVFSIASLIIGGTLSVVAMCTLLWMAIAGNETMWHPRKSAGQRALRETRFGRYARNTAKCDEMDNVVQRRRELLARVAALAVVSIVVAFGGVLVELIVRL